MKRLTALLSSVFLTAIILPAGPARYSIAADDGYVYATHPAEEGFAVSVFDVETPGAPLLVRTIRGAGTPTTPITISGDVGYLGTDEALHVIDLTCPERAAFLKTLRDGYHDDTVEGARAVGSYLIVEGKPDVRLYDISDPFTPVLCDALRAHATAPLAATFRFSPLFLDGACRLYELTHNGLVGRGLAGIAPGSTCFFVSSSVLYEVDRTSTRIHDFSIPGNPSIHPFTNSVMRPIPSHPRGRLWVEHKGQLEAWNVWKPLEPRRTKVLPFPEPGLLTNAFIRGDRCYVNDTARNALRIFSLDGNQASEIATRPFPATGKPSLPRQDVPARRTRPADLVTDGTLIFSTIGTNGQPNAIGVHDVSTPSSPRAIAEIGLDRPPLGLALWQGTNLLLAVDGRHLHVFSFSTNGPSTRLASLEISDFDPYGPQAISVDPRGFALLACRTDGVKSVNLAHIGNLAVTDGTTTGGFARDVVCSDGNVFVSDDTAGVTAYALSSDGALELHRTIPLPYGSAAGMASEAGRVYVTAQELPLALFANRPHPQCVGLCETGQDASFRAGAEAIDVAIVKRDGPPAKTTAFIIDVARGLIVCDVTDPSRPKALGTIASGKPSEPLPVATTSHGPMVFFLMESGEVRPFDASASLVPAMDGRPKAAPPKAPGKEAKAETPDAKVRATKPHAKAAPPKAPGKEARTETPDASDAKVRATKSHAKAAPPKAAGKKAKTETPDAKVRATKSHAKAAPPKAPGKEAKAETPDAKGLKPKGMK